MKYILSTLIITISTVIGFASFTALLIVNRIHSIHAVSGELVSTLGNGEYYLITVMTMLLVTVITFIIKERHFA